MEIWDAYYEDGSLAGVDLVRGEPIPSGFFHFVVEVVARHIDGSYLLMQRDWKKTAYPGLFEASASGCVLKGEPPMGAAKRELKEETGITAPHLTPLYTYRDQQHTFFYGYECLTDCEKSSITLQPGETISYRWLTKSEFLRAVDSGFYVPEHRKRLAQYLNRIAQEA